MIYIFCLRHQADIRGDGVIDHMHAERAQVMFLPLYFKISMNTWIALLSIISTSIISANRSWRLDDLKCGLTASSISGVQASKRLSA